MPRAASKIFICDYVDPSTHRLQKPYQSSLCTVPTDGVSQWIHRRSLRAPDRLAEREGRRAVSRLRLLTVRVYLYTLTI